VPFLSNEVLSPDDRASFSDRFRNWTSSPEDFTPQNPNLLVPAPEPDGPLGIFSGKPMSLSRLPSSVWGLPDNSDASGDGNSFNFLAGLAFQPTQPAPPLQADSNPMRSLGRRIVDQPPASMFDTRAPAAPLAPSDDPNVSGGLLGRFAALAGIDPQNPNQPAPPLDDEQEQADMRALDARLSNSGNIRDAVALYKARKSRRQKSAYDQA
jgi:hypothetical protein